VCISLRRGTAHQYVHTFLYRDMLRYEEMGVDDRRQSVTITSSKGDMEER
jgi:hypothetical protein